ncbi:tetratricopeptide repeat-containing sensor histidine kinase [Mangrovivirga sp. M17]|uniref:histidine kinase n=1 Tax=Mangrovivirga halotolerans TaxID=2993936 RepID=A0ABT3RLX5_9BACT|nr:tetratricopeptide repeat-containing sensor histidine kinase [Mangrovivirga halotolerans]MCX2742476.1 tetratricopeptide repeat-containing sensor histidine kinase [Mangrovivirga halotolerans]
MCIVAQNNSLENEIDSIKNELVEAKTNERIPLLYDLAYKYWNIDYDSALYYDFQALEIAENLKSDIWIAKLYNDIALVYKRKGSFKNALEYSNLAYEKALENGDNYQVRSYLSNLANIYRRFGDYEKSLEINFKALLMMENLNDSSGIAISYGNIGLVYDELKDNLTALEYYNKALDINRRINRKSGIIINLINLGYILIDLERIEEAERSFLESVRYSKKIEDFESLSTSYIGLAHVHLEKRSLDSATYYIDKSLEIERSQKDPFLLPSVYRVKAEVDFYKGNIDSALRSLDSAFLLSEKINIEVELPSIYRLYSQVYKEYGDYEKALFYQVKHDSIREKILGEDVYNKIARVQKDYLEEQKQSEIFVRDQKIKQNRLFIILLVAIVLILILSALIIYLSKVRMAKINKQLEEANLKVEAAKNTIEQQNQQLSNVNAFQEEMIKERTKELQKANKDLTDTNKELDLFIYKASHDLRGPLARINGLSYLGLLEAPEETSKNYFQMVSDETKELEFVLSRLMVIHTIYKHKLKKDSVYLETLVREIVAKLTETNKHIDIVYEFEVEKGTVWNRDEHLLRLILENMLENALNYKGDELLKVSMKISNSAENVIRIKVTDNGIQVPERYREDIFDMFFRVAPIAYKTGLELNIAKKATLRLGGEITYHPENSGNTFNIILPSSE